MEKITRIANDEHEKFRLNFSRCTNRDVAPLRVSRLIYLRILEVNQEKSYLDLGADHLFSLFPVFKHGKTTQENDLIGVEVTLKNLSNDE